MVCRRLILPEQEVARIKDISVFAVSTDRSGNRFSPIPTMTNDNGSFTFDKPITLDPRIRNNTAEVKIYAQSGELSGKDTVTIGREGFNRTIPIGGLTLLALPVIFIISIIVAIVQVGTARSLRCQYYGSILLALLFSFTMLAYLMVGLARIDEKGSPGEIFKIGFLNIFHGSYANGGAQSWIVSLTSDAVSTDAVSPEAIPPGLGAPLWVILMSVIGSASYTMLLLVAQIPSRIPFEDSDDIRKRVHQIAVHQFYVLVAPLGAILIYQTLVVAEAASQDVAVATRYRQ
jgi:hypothetical protein